MIILFSVLLLAFAVVIALLVVLIVRQRKKHKTKLTAIPKILESRVLQGTQDAATKKRPKSTNLEFLHSTTENRYNTTMSLGDTECCKPLVEKTLSGNEYIQCWCCYKNMSACNVNSVNSPRNKCVQGHLTGNELIVI